jgi:hypothetical protein
MSEDMANKWTEMLRIIHETECIWNLKTEMTNKRVTTESIKAKTNKTTKAIRTTEIMIVGEKIKRLGNKSNYF